MSLRAGFRDRFAWAFLSLEQRERPERVTQVDFANRVGKRIGETLTQAASQGWASGSVPRDLDTMVAVADELGVDPSWLYFERGIAPTGWQPILEKQEEVPIRTLRGHGAPHKRKKA